MRAVRVVGILSALCWLTAFWLTQAQATEPLNVPGLVRDLSSAQALTREQAAEALGKLGPAAADAVPALARAMSDQEPRVQYEALLALGRLGPAAAAAVPDLKAIVENPQSNLRLGAIEALGAIGGEAHPATDALIAIAKGDNRALTTAAVLALVRIHPGRKAELDRAVPVLMESLKSSEIHIRNDAIAALSEIGPAAVPSLAEAVKNHSKDVSTATRAASALAMTGGFAAAAVPALTDALSSTDEAMQQQAARALAAIGRPAEAAVPKLIGLLSSSRGGVRATAADALGQFGATGAAAVPNLAKLLKDSDDNVRREAVEALGRIGPAASSAVPDLVAALRDSQGAVTVHAAQALGHMGPEAARPVAATLKDPQLRKLALLILADLGPAAKGAVPDLVGLLTDKDVDIRREAQAALAQIGPGASAAIPNLVAMVNDEASPGPSRAGAAFALVKIGARAEVLPILAKTVDAGDKNLRDVSAWGLVTLEPANPDYIRKAVPVLVDGLSREMDLVRRESAATLGRLGPSAQAAVPELAKAFENEKSVPVQMEIVQALAEIGPGAAGAMPAVLAALNDAVPPMRYRGCYAAGKIGAAAKDAVPVLTKNLQSRDEFLAILSAWALAHVAPAQESIAEKIVPLLSRGLKLPNPEARREALAALAALGSRAKAALPDIDKLAGDQDEGVRKAADAAKKKISG